MSTSILVGITALVFNVFMAIFNYRQASIDTQERVQEILSVLPIIGPLIMSAVVLIELFIRFLN